MSPFMVIEYVLLLAVGVFGFYMLAPPVSSTAALIVCVACALLCACAVFLIWRMFRDK